MSAPTLKEIDDAKKILIKLATHITEEATTAVNALTETARIQSVTGAVSTKRNKRLLNQMSSVVGQKLDHVTKTIALLEQWEKE